MMVRAVAVGVTGGCLAVIVAAEGSPGWQVVRGLLVVGVTVGAVHATRTRDGVQRGAVLFGVGMIAIAVGVGIALPHLAKSDLTLRAVAAVGALAAGVVALVLGTIDLAGAVRGWRRVPVVTGLVFLALIALRTLGPAVAATNVPTIELGTETPGDRGLEYVDVELRTQHGTVLSGWYLPSRNGAAVVALHGAGSTRSSVLDQAIVLADHGFGVLLYDARGHGDSEGQAMDFGWMGNEDIGAALAFLERQPDVNDERIGVLGLSMGGEQAIGAAAGDPRIMAVVAEGATGRVAGDYAVALRQLRARRLGAGATRPRHVRHDQPAHRSGPAHHAARRGRRVAAAHAVDRCG